MPSSLVASGHDGPVVKRQKLNGVDAPRRTQRESKIFTPFRVWLQSFRCAINMLTDTDNRVGFLYCSSFHLDTPRKDNLPDHHLCWQMPPNLRSQARPQPRLPDSTTDARGYYSNGSMERPIIRSMGRVKRVYAGSLDFQAGEGRCRIGHA